MVNQEIKAKREPLFHITKRQDVSNKRKWITKAAAILCAFLFCATVSSICGGNFLEFFKDIFEACFINLGPGGAISATKIFDLLEKMAILLLIALALIPAFKMKFWNIGAEGQIMIAVLMCAVLQKYLGPLMATHNGFTRLLFFIILIIMCMLAGAIWGVIPAIFKARFNTNETLFTLMMNYIAIFVTQIVIYTWDPAQGSIPSFDDATYFPKIGGQQVILNLIIIAAVAALLFVYLKYTKHGYEINVVGGSTDTARYIGIKVKKVIIRTMVLSGAICGLCGCLMVAGEHNNLTTSITGGRGFTGVLIAWIGGLNIGEISLYAFLSAFITKGSSKVNNNSSFPNLMLAVAIFVLIAFEFLINYEIKCEKLKRFVHDKFPNFGVKKDKQKPINEDVPPMNDLHKKGGHII